jgi:hypothetical protein
MFKALARASRKENNDDDGEPNGKRVHFEVPAARAPRQQQKTSVTTISEMTDEVAMPPPPPSKRPKKAATGVTKRPHDVIIEDTALSSDVLRKSVEPAGAVMHPVKKEPTEESESVSVNNVFTIDTYATTSRFLVDSMLRAAGDESGTGRDSKGVKAAMVHGQQRQFGLTSAAHTNYMIRVMDSERARTTTANGDTLLDATPYSDSTVSAFASNFIANAIECAPDINAHEHNDEALELRACSTGITYDLIETFLRTAHSTEFACAAASECVGMELYDEHGNRLPPTVLKVFFFPEQLAAMQNDPNKFEQEAKLMYCIGCKIKKANECAVNAASRNNRVLPHVLAADFHVFVDQPGEFPIVCTRGRLSNGHNGLTNNVPTWTRYGWQAAPDGQRANSYVYKMPIPRYPIPRSYYERDVGQGF